MINILSTPSDNYAMPCGVMFYSACVNNKKSNLHFYVVTDNSFTEENKNKLRETVTPFGNQIDFIIIDDNDINISTGMSCSYYPKYVFYRLFAFKYLPQNVSKILYLDCDIIIRADLSDLWEIDISNYGIAGVPDAQEGRIQNYNRLGYSSEKGYYNAGVIMMNLDFWRNNNVEVQIRELMTEHSSKLELYDQDVLNSVFQSSKKYLPLKYNAQSGFFYHKRFYLFEYLKYKQDLKEAISKPIILHLCGPQPWSKGCSHPFKSEFFKYRDQTIWKNTPLWKNRRSLSKRFFDLLRKPLKRFGVYTIEDKYDRTLTLD